MFTGNAVQMVHRPRRRLAIPLRREAMKFKGENRPPSCDWRNREATTWVPVTEVRQ